MQIGACSTIQSQSEAPGDVEIVWRQAFGHIEGAGRGTLAWETTRLQSGDRQGLLRCCHRLLLCVGGLTGRVRAMLGLRARYPKQRHRHCRLRFRFAPPIALDHSVGADHWANFGQRLSPIWCHRNACSARAGQRTGAGYRIRPMGTDGPTAPESFAWRNTPCRHTVIHSTTQMRSPNQSK